MAGSQPPVYSQQIWAQAGLAGTVTVAPPAGYKYVVRDIDVFYVTGLAGADFHAEIEIPGVAFFPTFAFMSWSAADPSSVKSWRGRQVVQPGQALILLTTGALDVTCSGYALSLP